MNEHDSLIDIVRRVNDELDAMHKRHLVLNNIRKAANVIEKNIQALDMLNVHVPLCEVRNCVSQATTPDNLCYFHDYKFNQRKGDQ